MSFTRSAFVDDKQFAREFSTGDFVRKSNLRSSLVTPFVGRVLFSNTDTGRVAVQWPWGDESESPTELIKVAGGDLAGPALDTSYSTWESARWTTTPESTKSDAKWRSGLAASIVRDFEKATLPVYRAACKAFYDAVPEVDALLHLSSLSDTYGFDVVRRTIANVYADGRRIAIYWKDGNRRYRVTQSEKQSGKMKCPRCGGHLKPRRYRAGRNLLQCRSCGFSIHQRDLI